MRPAKRGGAFCASAVPSVQPYVLLNYTSRRRDVLTLAHELGHGVHFALAARQGIFHQHTPLTLAETASVFGETIVFGRLLAEDSSPASRLALLAENLEDTIATVFRQVAMNRFEDLVHTARREQGELSVERFGELWAESQAELLGDSVELTEGYRSWWSYIPHFIGSPGYVYAYAYGQLLALSVYERYEQIGAELVPRYLELLAAGGSRSPEELGQIVGIDLADPGFWEAGLDLVERQLREAEEAAEASGRLQRRARAVGCARDAHEARRRRPARARRDRRQPGAAARRPTRCTGMTAGRVLGVAQRLGVFAQAARRARRPPGAWPRSSGCRSPARACCARTSPAWAILDQDGHTFSLRQALAQVARPGLGHLHRHLARAHGHLLGVVRRPRADRARRRQLRDPPRAGRGRGVLARCTSPASTSSRACRREEVAKAIQLPAAADGAARRRRRARLVLGRAVQAPRDAAGDRRSTSPAARASGARSSPRPA